MMISKSSYVTYKECGKKLFLHFCKPDEASELSEIAIKNIEDGNEVGQLAKQYFPNTIDCSVKTSKGIDYNEQIRLTKEAIASGADAIAEASFMVGDLFCAVDLLKKEKDGYSIYEVKSSLDLKDKHKYDVAFQKYVLTQCGINIVHMYLMHPNRNYIFDGTLDLNKYFKVDCFDEEKLVLGALEIIEDDINDIRALLSSSVEPEQCYIDHCEACDFFKYCSRNLPKNSIGELKGFKTKAFEFYNKGIYTIEEYVNTLEYKIKQEKIAKGKNKKDPLQSSQIKCVLEGIKEPVVNKTELEKFLNSINYPIYHLDFETTRLIVPVVKGTRPEQEIAFEYSLHIEDSDGSLRHEEYLGNSFDCERELAEKLLRDIPHEGTLMAQHACVEKGVIMRLAETFPDLHDELMQRHERFVDLEHAFTKGAYYDIKMGGNSSIKKVMPALCPHMANAYHDLPLVHNGSEALVMYKKLIKTTDDEEKQRIRQGMLDYCELDTLSMVEILKVLRKAL